jgi:putative glutamine amidotransferase
MVNSSHHQAIRIPGDGLVPVAWSEDGLIEAIELGHRNRHPFLLGIQWHPERMDASLPMSGPVGKAFLQKAEQFRK